MDDNYWYPTPEDFKIAEANGLSRQTVLNRINNLAWEVERAITEPLNVKTSRITEEQYKIAEENGIDRQNVLNRVCTCKWDIEKAITKPLRKRRKSLYPSKEVEEACLKLGITFNCYKLRTKQYGWSVEKAISTPPYNRRPKQTH